MSKPKQVYQKDRKKQYKFTRVQPKVRATNAIIQKESEEMMKDINPLNPLPDSAATSQMPSLVKEQRIKAAL